MTEYNEQEFSNLMAGIDLLIKDLQEQTTELQISVFSISIEVEELLESIKSIDL
jgi:hypothetical protein